MIDQTPTRYLKLRVEKYLRRSKSNRRERPRAALADHEPPTLPSSCDAQLMSTRPWDIYARELLPCGYGHPLWVPEPSASGREILMGDVGWVDDGEFRALFNSREDADHPINCEMDTPQNFKAASNLWAQCNDRITQTFICSRSIRQHRARALPHVQ